MKLQTAMEEMEALTLLLEGDAVEDEVTETLLLEGDAVEDEVTEDSDALFSEIQ